MKECLQEDFLLKRNLKDAGFGPKGTEEFLRLGAGGCVREQLAMLSRQRIALLKKVHDNQSRIDCLDHLINKMKGIQS